MKQRKRSLVILAIALVLMLLSATVQRIVVVSGGAVEVTMLHEAENTSTVTVEGESKAFDGLVVSGALFVPKGASETNKLPAVVLTHGYLNDWEKQYQNAIELSKRGFVVVAVDRAGHGENNQPISGSLGYGGTTADYDQSLTLAGRYVYNLPFVDRDKIVVSGHSMGGFATSMTLMKDATDAYGLGVRIFCAGLMQAWDTPYGAAPGVSVGILKSNDDEFFFKGTDPVTGKAFVSREYLNTSAARSFVNSTGTDPVITNHIYVDGVDTGVTTGGQTAQPGFRVIYEANEIHTLNHFSVTSAANVVNFVYSAVGVPSGYSYLPETSQTWWIKEAVGILGIVGFYMLFLPLFDLLLSTPLFAGLRKRKEDLSEPPAIKGAFSWGMLIISGLIGSLFAGFTLRAVSNYGAANWHTSALYPQEHSNWLAFWCVVNGLVVLALAVITSLIKYYIRWKKTGDGSLKGEFLGSANVDGFKTVAKSFVMVAIVFLATQLVLALIKDIFHVDFRLWLYTVKNISVAKITTALRYTPVFFVFYGINAWNVSNHRFKNIPEWASTLMMCVFNCLGLALIFAIQYGTFKTTGSLWHDDMGTRYPTLLTVMPMLCVSTIYSKQLYKRTGNCWTAAFLTSLLAAFACVSGPSSSVPYSFL